MKPKPNKPRSYGRQSEGKTIKSVSVESEVALFADRLAEERGLSLSAMINEMLKEAIPAKVAKTKKLGK